MTDRNFKEFQTSDGNTISTITLPDGHTVLATAKGTPVTFTNDASARIRRSNLSYLGIDCEIYRRGETRYIQINEQEPALPEWFTNRPDAKALESLALCPAEDFQKQFKGRYVLIGIGMVENMAVSFVQSFSTQTELRVYINRMELKPGSFCIYNQQEGQYINW